MNGVLDRFFSISKAGSTPAVEVRAGVTTFLTMSYILFVNPVILANGIQVPNAAGQLMTVTALAAAGGTLLMGLWARYPFALAPGMGLNAYFTYTVVLGQGVPWQTALGAVFLSGCLFLAISLAGLREHLIRAIPAPLKIAITAGIGSFLAMIGLSGAGLIQDHPVTLVTLGALHQPGALLALFGVLLTTVLLVRAVPGAVILGILAVSLLAILTGAPVFNGASFAGFSDGLIRRPVWPVDLIGALDLASALELGVVSIVITFLFVDFFDTAGTLMALSRRTAQAGADGVLPRGRAAYSVDALATCAGAFLGTSSTTSYIESSAGIAEGGRTGLTSVVTAVCFLACLVFWPLAAAVPAAATAPALITIGALMMTSLGEIPWQDPAVALPVMLTVLGMPLTYSITDGLALGLVSYTLIQVAAGRGKQLHRLLPPLTLLVILRYVFA